jgi:hypothetical protein
MRKRYFFYTSDYFDRHVFFGVCIDGQMFKATNGQAFCRGPICLLEWIGAWGKQQTQFIEKGTWKYITPEQARDTIPDGHRSNFPFPQLLKSDK